MLVLNGVNYRNVVWNVNGVHSTYTVLRVAGRGVYVDALRLCSRAMKSQAPDEVIARIQEARDREPGGAVAFDGDGTLWGGDIGEEFYYALVANGRFEALAEAELARVGKDFGIQVAEGSVGRGRALASKIYDEYLAQRFPEELVCEVVAWACGGWKVDEVRAFAQQVLRERELASRLHAEAAFVLEWARGAGIEVYLVSASPRMIVEEGAKLVGVDAAHVVAATAMYDGAVMQPEVARPIPYGPGKVTGLRACIGARPLYAAFGDNAFDVTMLREAKVPVAVRPKPRLIAKEGEIPGLVELGRI